MASTTPAFVVRVESGSLAGLRDVATGVSAWLGIPFAAAPLGDLRWRLPAPVKPWHGVRPADRFAPQCVQPGRPAGSVYAEFAGTQPMSEDCLHLNVWSPAAAPGDALPVMVWIHGGAFQQGSGTNPVFVRGNLPRHGVVLVTLNYRLGPFGFLAHPELSAEGGGASGNFGLHDIAAALRWVQRNIAGFGGDPGRVTIFGQSAGAQAVVALMAAPAARGLFRHAMAQSFGFGKTASLAEAERQGADFAQGAGVPTVAELRALPAGELLRRYLAQAARAMPIVDGRFLSQPVDATFAAGAQHAVPLLTGWNRDEGSAFPAFAKFGSAQAFRAHLQQRFGNRAEQALALYPASSEAQAAASSQALFGDELFAAGVHAAAVAHRPRAPTYLYHFTHPQPFAPEQRFVEADPATRLGAFHSSEYPYVFGTTRELTRDWTAADDTLTELMQGCWLRFAKTGNPNGGGAPAWPLLDDAMPSVLQLAPAPAVVDVPRRAHLALLA